MLWNNPQPLDLKTPTSNNTINITDSQHQVLGFAGLLESYTALIAWRELSREAKKAKMSTKDYITDGKVYPSGLKG